MKKINYLLLFACSPFLIQPAQAFENSVFNDTASFTLAKAVKLGRSATSLGNASSELRDQLGGLNGGNQSNACLTGYYNSGVNGCQACSDTMTGCLECESAAACKKCDISKKYELINNSCKLGVCSWNHNGSVVLATQCSNIDGYGRTSSITVPDTNPKYGTVNIRFWDNATVSGGAFTATNLKSTGHTSWELGNLDSVITFNNPVTVTGTVILQEDSSDAAKGVKMVFNAGLKGNPKCVVEKQVASSGCSSASCSKSVETNNTCTCTTRECTIDAVQSTCTSSNRFSWNANGSMSVPSGYSCIDGYGANSNITMPSSASFTEVNIRFWDRASVSGSFTTSALKSLGHTSWYLDDLDTVITFNDPVTVNGTVYLQEASSSKKGARKGVTMKFSKGLKGSPNCVVEKKNESSGCGYASCSSNATTDAICVCSSTECVIKDPIPSCGGGHFYAEAIGNCVQCQPGTYSTGGSATSCQTCPTGTYSGTGASSCTKVPAVTNCSTYSTTTGKCTKCNSGYTLNNGKCTKTSTSTTVDCTRCESGYTKNLTSCPSGQTLQQGRICVDSGFSCGKCVAKSSSSSGGGGGGGNSSVRRQQFMSRFE